jgi:metal-responsive CopG/Arc/MetJ family transcriptional regulator
MRVKISATLSEELLRAIDDRAKREERTRSDLIEAALWAFIERRTRKEQNAHDLATINRHAGFLNKEAADVLEYQPCPFR